MNKLLVVAFVVGCGPPTPASQPPISNTAPISLELPPKANADITIAEVVRAYTGTTGGIKGTVKGTMDEPLPGATVVAMSPALTGQQVAITDDEGVFAIENLPPGSYTVTFFYAAVMLQHAVPVRSQHVTRLKVERWKIPSGSDR